MARPISTYPRDTYVWLGVLGFLTLLWGCAMPVQTSLDVITLGRAVGLRSPYQSSHFFAAEPPVVLAHLVHDLETRGAQLLVADSSSGLLSWCDPGISFIAIPTQLSKPSSVSTAGLAPQLTVWHGTVHGTARLRATGGGAWLYLHTVGREAGSKSAVFSDGSYERSVLSTVVRDLDRGRLPSSGAAGQSPVTPRSVLQPAATALRTCAPHLGNLSSLSLSEVRAKGIAKVYPVPLAELWAACLDVLVQYDMIVRMSVEDGVLVFARGMTLPKDIIGDELQRVDVVLALQAEARGRDGSTLSVAALAQPGLEVRSVPDLSKQVEKEVLTALKKAPPELAAALLIDQFFAQFTTQLFYKDRWQDKLIRRFSEPDKGP